MNHILLIRPPNINAGYSFLASNPPLNLMYLAASLENNQIPVQILDFEGESYSDAKLLKKSENY